MSAPAATAEPAPRTAVDAGLHAWCASDSSHLLLDLRSRDAFQRQRLSRGVCLPWPELELNWFALPAQVVPFAVLMPSAEDAAAQSEENRKRQAQTTAKPTAVAPGQEEDGARSSTKVPAAAPPPAPSSPMFEYSPSAILALLRFYRWTIPDEWVFSDSPAFWQSAAGVPSLRLCGPSDPIERRILFAPSPYLDQHFAYVQEQLVAARHSQPTDSNKQARSETAQCVTASTSASESASASACTSSPSVDASTPFHCLDVACGSGRDLCWLLWQSAKSSWPSWRATGVDVSASSLERATHLARQLGVEQHLETVQARINQATGEWRVTWPDQQKQATPAASPAAAAAATTVACSPLGSAASDASSAGAAAMVDQPAGAKSQQQRREKRKQKDAMRAAAAAAVATAGATAPPFLHQQYDLIVIVRFLSRVFFRTQLSRLLKPGGFFLLSTFIEDGVLVHWESPANPEFRIQGREEIVQFAREAGLEVIRNEIGRCEDGRPISDCLLRKPISA